MTSRRRVLLGQLGANGDCVYATTVARQIKADDPECHLTWAIASQYRQVIAYNPHVDEVWDVTATRDNMNAAWHDFASRARDRKRRGEFDDVYLTQISPANYHNFDGTVRSSIFRGYPRPITVPVTPVVRLSTAELEHVRHFADANGLTGSDPAIIFECSAHSGQSSMTPSWATEAATIIVDLIPTARIVLSSRPPANLHHPRIIDGSVLRFRDYAALTHYCSLLIGCSSGITWVCTSDAARRIPTIQILAKWAGVFGAVTHDLDYWGLPSDHVVELRDCTIADVTRCTCDVVSRGVVYARKSYDTSYAVHFEHYAQTMLALLTEGHASSVCSSLRHNVARYGVRSSLWRDVATAASSRVIQTIRRRLGLS